MEPVALHGLVDAADQLGVELAVEIGEQHADGAGLSGAEAAGGGVRGIAEALGDGADAAAGGLRDQAAAVVRAGDGGDRDPRGAGDILNRNHWGAGCNRLHARQAVKAAGRARGSGGGDGRQASCRRCGSR